jgi:hypothetical protein
MEPEGSLPHSQVPSTCPYAEPAQSSPNPHIPPISFFLILSPAQYWVRSTDHEAPHEYTYSVLLLQNSQPMSTIFASLAMFQTWI